ncbi:MAG: MBL fold metallo-hydrolase [Acidobacteriota bacterium]|nr:MBL fold metallo-hydrolase [Acidobacteriota bacterium]
MEATLTFLGSGTSMGVPTLGCGCAVCVSATPAGLYMAPAVPRNRRTRPSVMIEWGGHTVVIDTGPDFHAQAIREGLRQVDAVLYTHGHADHVLGMDDLRPLTFRHAGGVPLYADAPTADTIERVFDYTFRKQNRYPTSARVNLIRIPAEPGAEIDLFGVRFLRVPVIHGKEEITGYRFGAAAYLTDLSDVPDSALDLLRDLDVLILDALRPSPHPSHSHLSKSVAIAEQLAANRTFFTHMGHELDHDATEAILPAGMKLAYDGLRLQFEIARDRAEGGEA